MKKLKNILIIFICFLMFSGFNDETSSFEYIPTYNINNEAAGAFTSSYPSSYDLRGTANNLQAFKNITSESQGSLNICWAFATNNVIEAYMNKIKNNTVTYNYSENQYDYVSRYLGDTKSFGEANTTFNVVKYLFYSVSPMKESDFHSSGYFTNYIEKPLNSYLNLSKSELDISDLKIFSPLDYKGLMNSDKTAEQIEDGMKTYIEPVKEYIYKYGAVMSIIHSKFLTQSSGNNDGWCYNNGSQSESSYTSSAHAITIIGWDDNYVWNGSNKAPYKGAWIAANSWGTNTSFFHISYYDYSVSRAFIGISLINDNSSKTFYSNSYLAGESTSFYNEFGDNRIRSYERISTSKLSESFKVYLGDGSETIQSAKLLYLGFKNTSRVPSNLKVKVEVATTNNNPTFYDKIIKFGITPYSLTHHTTSGYVTVNVSITNNTDVDISNMLYAVELFTKNSDGSKKIYLGGNDKKTNSSNSRVIYNVVSKNVDATDKNSYTVKVYDDKSNDITNSFSVKKEDLTFDTSSIKLVQKSTVSSSYITLKTTVGSTTSSKKITYASNGYTITNMLVDETNNIIYGISPDMASAQLTGFISGGTKTVTTSNGSSVSGTSKMGTGYKVNINYNNNNYSYTISVLGDVNSDGKVDISDVMKIATQITKGKKYAKQIEYDAADATKDDKIDISDVMKVATYVVKKVGL